LVGAGDEASLGAGHGDLEHPAVEQERPDNAHGQLHVPSQQLAALAEDGGVVEAVDLLPVIRCTASHRMPAARWIWAAPACLQAAAESRDGELSIASTRNQLIAWYTLLTAIGDGKGRECIGTPGMLLAGWMQQERRTDEDTTVAVRLARSLGEETACTSTMEAARSGAVDARSRGRDGDSGWELVATTRSGARSMARSRWG
jgi:hypothetical protein